MMPTLADILFLASLTCLLIHELDAVQQAEGRFFFAWTGWSDKIIHQWFCAAHVPLFMLILLGLPSIAFRLGLAVFMLAHALAHLILRHHPLVHFNHWFSRLWIGAAAFFALLYLALMAQISM